MSTNYDILNFLNLTCPSLARLYKTTGISFLPEDFVLDKEKIKERMFFDSLEEEIKYPSFIFGEKKEIKNYLKKSLKNIKKIIKNQFFVGFFNKKFENKLKFYFFARQKLTARLLRRFNSYDFDEMRAYREIFHLDPIFDELFANLYFDDIDFSSLFFSLEQEYTLSYEEKLKMFNTKSRRQKCASVQKQIEIAKTTVPKKEKISERKTKVIQPNTNIEEKKQQKTKENIQKIDKKTTKNNYLKEK